jgi:hypothetical protein
VYPNLLKDLIAKQSSKSDYHSRRESCELVEDMISSIDTIENGLPRRPRSLTQASVGSIHAFSMFGSVDSEQSLPRTAPLATPEQVFLTFEI